VPRLFYLFVSFGFVACPQNNATIANLGVEVSMAEVFRSIANFMW
jgi:hypothetical protein